MQAPAVPAVESQLFTTFDSYLKNYIDTSKCKEVLGTLFDSGYGINTRNSQRETLLHLAIQNNTEEIVDFLIERGADVNVPDGNGCNALQISIDNARPHPGNKRTCARVKKLILAGADVNCVSPLKGWTAAHLAAFESDSDLSAWLYNRAASQAAAAAAAAAAVAVQSNNIQLMARNVHPASGNHFQ